MAMAFHKFKLDIEVGTLVRSPCRKCIRHEQDFPQCIDECDILDKIHRILAETRPTSKG